MVETNENYWDCECEEDYIHEKAKKKHCVKCDTYEDEQPDSRQSEVEEVKLIERIRNICSTNVDVDWLENDASEEFARIIELIDNKKQNT